ncbi:MAG: GYDIA family GHMP kinase [Flavobacteriaceae bacterium]|nr:GYDIA family GHMP kinase [Flavobacteriaceae bacterium]
MNHFFSHGKLLLTSEYLVLDGALALAVPTRLGQEFLVEEISNTEGKIFWEAFHQGKSWLKIEINYKNWKIINTNLPDNANFILKTLQNVQKLSTQKLQNQVSYSIKTNLQFPANFGLGSSSTLMNNLSQWAEIDAFQLNEMSLGGSGYDIAVAQNSSPILYQLTTKNRRVEKVEFNPSFKNELIFIHLNQKQDSREGIQLYRSKEKPISLISEFSELTEKILICKDIDEFSKIMQHHETQLSKFLGLKSVKEKLFPDCSVFIKSLGAWGGDFILTQKFDGYQDYFNQKGFNKIFTWEEMIFNA